MLKRRRGRREPLHQYIVGVPIERLAMDVAGPYPVTSAGNQYCLMVGCYFSKWLECFPIPDQKATTVARKLVFEIVARYGAFRELHSDQGTNFGTKVQSGTGGVPVVWDTQDADYALPPQERRIHRTEFQDAGPMFESGVPRDEAGVGRARATDPDQLPGDATSEHRSDPQHDDVGSADEASGPGYVWSTPGTEEEASTVSEYVAALQGGLRAAYRHARAGLQRAALHQKHDYDGKVQRREYQAGELVWIHDITLERTRGTKLQFPWFGPALITKVLDRGRVVVRRKRDKSLAVMHVDRLETYRGTAVPAWMTTEQRECVAV